MPSNAFQLGKLLISSGEVKISPENVSDDFSTIEQVSSTDALSASGNAVGDQRIVGNNLYIWNGTGWYRIALINETPTWDSGGQPFSSYILDADSPQDATVITLSASDPDGLPITYSYVTSGSMDSMATISQDSSVFTITPKTVAQVGEGVELTGSITFRASDGVNILPQISSFTLRFIATIENSKYTTLLATAVDTSTNNVFTDSSTNNHTVTGYGNVYAGAFSPYRHGGYSTYFDGTGDYINAPSSHSSFALGTNDFTYECWFYPQNLTGCLVSKHSTGSPQWFELRVSSGYIYVGLAFSNEWGPMQTGTIPVPANKWCHVALVRNGSSFSVFVNGVLDTGISISNTGSISNNTSYPFRIGARGAADLQYNGYISDARLVNGTALYTSNFTPPTERLTAITNTSLLTCHLPYIADGSSNGHSITVNGNPYTKQFAPYDNLEYIATDHGGSIYFDGSGDYLRADAGLSSFTSSTSPFTIEAYVYPSTASLSSHYLFGINTTSSGANNLLFNTHQIVTNHGGGGDTVTTLSSPITYNVWSHVALVSDGTTLKAFINGNEYASTTAPSTPLADCVLGIGTEFDTANGGTPGNYYTGYISDIRISDTALYTSAFTPTFSPLTTPSGTTLHIKATDASIIDKAQVSNLQLVGNTTGSTAQAKFANTKSMYFDGNGDSVFVPYESIPSFGIIEFTIEGWIYMNNLTGNQIIVDKWVSGNSQGFQLYYRSTGTSLTFYVGSSIIVQDPSGSTISAQTWHHVAVTRDSSANVRLYVDGLKKAQSTSNVSLDNTLPLRLGTSATSTNYFNGYMQDVKLSNKALYTADDESSNIPSAPLKG